MRLRNLLIEKYGNLDRADLAFEPAPGCLNLLVAPNGAGKSVLRRAFHDLLFGIPLQSEMRFRFDYPGMHLRADAISAEGQAFTFGWQRKAGRVFPNAAGDPAAARWLAELVAAVTPDQVKMLFALDTERLRSGGRDLAAGDGTLGSALLSGTGELMSARALRRSLDDRRTAIWERSKSSRPLNGALARLAAAAKQRRDSVQTPRTLGALQTALEDTRARKHRASEAAAATQARLNRLNRIELTRGPLAVLADATAWLAAYPDAPVLPDGLGEELVRARHEASLAKARLDAARAQAVEAEARMTAIVRDTAADAAEAELARLPGALGDATAKRRDVGARRTERAEALAEVSVALRDIGSAVAPDQAGSLIPTLPDMAAARDRISQHTASITTLALAQARLQKAQLAVGLLDSEAEAASVPSPEGLAGLLADIRRTREPLAHAAELSQRVRQAEAAEQACLARVPGWDGMASDLTRLRPAPEPAYDRLAQTVADAAVRLAQAATDRDRLRAERARWGASLAALRQQPLPDAAALAAVRAQRDLGWRLIYARAFAQAPDEAGERAYAGDDALPMAFERQLRAADAVADARIGELERVEKAARLAADIAGSDAAWSAAGDAVAGATQRHREATTRWAEACAALRLPPDTSLRELAALLAARDDAIEAGRLAALARGDQAAVAALHAGWADRLAGLLDCAAAPLASVLPLADARLHAAERTARDAVAREARRAQAASEMQAAVAVVAAAEDVLRRWQAGWDDVLLRLGRPAGETPVVTEQVLARFSELDRQYQAAASLHRRIDDMEADLTGFASQVREVAARLAMPPDGDVFVAATLLIARRDAARTLAGVAEEAGLAREKARTRVDDALQQDRAAAAVLAAVMASCGAIDPEAAERQVIAARERARRERARDQAEARLREVGGDASFVELAAELAALPPDQFEVARLEANAGLTRARQDEQDAAVALAALERQYAADASATGASEAAESESAAAAEVGRLLEDYLLLRVASGMLGRALERVEESAGPTGVQRIAAAFEAITDGAWTIRASETSKGETLLLAVERAFNEPAKQINQLSEGTRDQLYLALRLVAIESHVAAAPPLPFIADDILQTFDDARARAAMQALIGLSQHVQVIVLTHHPHLLEVAKGLPVHVVSIP